MNSLVASEERACGPQIRDKATGKRLVLSRADVVQGDALERGSRALVAAAMVLSCMGDTAAGHRQYRPGRHGHCNQCWQKEISKAHERVLFDNCAWGRTRLVLKHCCP